MHLPVLRDVDAVDARLDQVRATPQARSLLDDLARAAQALVQAAERDGSEATLERLGEVHARLDRYLDHLSANAEVRPTCRRGCGACCADLPPALPLEQLRVARTLATLPDGGPRLARARELGADLRRMLRAAGATEDASDPAYREVQLTWRRRGLPCPALDADGACSVHSNRPLACRVYVSVQPADRCAPDHPELAELRPPALWHTLDEAPVEVAIATAGRLLELPPAPNLLLGLGDLSRSCF